jgi:hypothetical protein
MISLGARISESFFGCPGEELQAESRRLSTAPAHLHKNR